MQELGAWAACIALSAEIMHQCWLPLCVGLQDHIATRPLVQHLACQAPVATHGDADVKGWRLPNGGALPAQNKAWDAVESAMPRVGVKLGLECRPAQTQP